MIVFDEKRNLDRIAPVLLKQLTRFLRTYISLQPYVQTTI